MCSFRTTWEDASLVAIFTAALEGMRKALFARPHTGRLTIALAYLLQARFNRMTSRFAALYALWEAGKLPKPRTPRPSRARPDSAESLAEPRLHCPHEFGWMHRHFQTTGPGDHILIATSHNDLAAMLQMPRLQEFAAAAPQIGRILRPLCRMLAIPAPDFLKLPKRPRRAIPKRARRPRAPRPAPAPAPPPPLHPFLASHNFQPGSRWLRFR